MRRELVAGGLALGLALFVALGGAPAPRARAQSPSVGTLMRGKIKHVVVIVQENRTFDNLFGGPPVPTASVRAYPNADSTWPPGLPPMKGVGFNSSGAPAPSNAHNVWQCIAQGGFTVAAWQAIAQHGCSAQHANGPDAVFQYIPQARRAIYWEIARRYELADRFFAITSTGSFPAHQFIVAQQSAAQLSPSAAPVVVADQPSNGNACFDNPRWASVMVPVLQSNGFSVDTPAGYAGECYPWKTYADLMPTPAPSGTPFWKHYETQLGSGPFNGFINMQNWYQATNGTPEMPLSSTQLAADIQAGALPAFAWVKPACVAVSDHPGVAAHEYGPEWVGYVVNQILTSPAAQSTAIFIIWDDWGGFYDHVAPPALRPDGIGPGLRTPLLLVSAYGAAPGAVVHTTSDYASVMKFSEDLFGLPRLNAVDANAADLVGFFNTAANATPAPVPTIAAAVADPYVPSTMCPAGAPRASANMED
ncbi:MAG: hypothetical protein QOI11_986 [Candidatus Eremiobacteraeota bacterium]|jgi:phospholipase C|nr:hypothetical protein [Candidatus Eremiobacteraeota bacterium]